VIRQQRTINREFTLSGTGLHTGEDVSLRIKPAPPDTGIRFIKVRGEHSVEIKADINSVSSNSVSFRNTTLSYGDEKIHTVEHLLASCYGLQVDNLIIEIEGDEPPEPPRGSYEEIAKAFQQVGFKNQGVPVQMLAVDTVISYTDGDVELMACPADHFRISFTIDYANKYIGTQYASFALTPEVFMKEISPARTFVLWDDVEKLRKMGLIKGGSLDNAIVFKEDGLMNKDPLRFTNECARHKILDLLGDLSLVGCPIKAHIHAVKSGHVSNIEFVKKLWNYRENKKKLSGYPRGGEWDINVIQKIMPHRYPLLLVDKITELEDKKRVVGIKNVTINEPFFAGHFPGHPIMPAVLIVEAMAQVGGVLLLSSVDNPEKYLVYFTRIDNAKFRKPVLPGDQLRFELELLSLRRRICKMQGFAYVDNDLVAEAELLSIIVDR
jgi:UDP-3-O-[3-hydroxymyristoyl] N-acetylglucosamine deacetylase/3-hydroxyacyl-[acyl-carrier-protein] dehydratase